MNFAVHHCYKNTLKKSYIKYIYEFEPSPATECSTQKLCKRSQYLCFARLIKVGGHFVSYENGGLRVLSCFLRLLVKKKKDGHKLRIVY